MLISYQQVLSGLLITKKASKTPEKNKHYQQAIITTILVFKLKILNIII